MMPEETQKKVYLYIIIALVIAGAIFVIWATVFNRGTLTINAKAPFLVQVEGLLTESCETSPCVITLAPNDYKITLQKSGYKAVSLDVKIPIGGDHKEDVQFALIPVISKLGAEADLKLFSGKALAAGTESIATSPETPLFYEDNYVTYLQRDPESKRQTLYVRTAAEGQLSQPTVATSFIRTILEYKIFPNIEDINKVALLDRAASATDSRGPSATLYMIDLTEKTRNAVLAYPYINGLKWIKSSDDFFFEATDEGEISSSIYKYNSNTGEAIRLALKTPINNIAAISEDRIIAAINQYSPTNTSTADTTELAATPDATSGKVDSNTVGEIAFIDYGVPENKARLITLESSLPPVEKIKLQPDKKSLIFLSAGNIYELKFEE